MISEKINLKLFAYNKEQKSNYISSVVAFCILQFSNNFVAFSLENYLKFQHFFLVVYLTLALNSPVKIYSLIHANKKLYYINIAKYAIEIFTMKYFYYIFYI